MVGLDAGVRGALSRVMDPCSVAAGRPTSVLDLGLVLGWELAGGVLRVRFTITFAGCTMAPHFMEAARTELLGVAGIAAVETVVDTGHVWQPPSPVPIPGVPQAWRQHTAGAAPPTR